MGFDPYSASFRIALKIGAYAVLATVLVSGWFYVQTLRQRVRSAQAATAQLQRDLGLMQRNAALASLIAERAADRERQRVVRVAAGKKEVFDAKVPVPPECRPVLAPLERAADWVRRSQAEGRGDSAASGAGVP